jgi:hypothetical protein
VWTSRTVPHSSIGFRRRMLLMEVDSMVPGIAQLARVDRDRP